MSKKLKLSPWHDGSVKPVHVGVYQRKWTDGNIVYTNWTGNHWSWSFGDIKLAEVEKSPTWNQSMKWRGVLK